MIPRPKPQKDRLRRTMMFMNAQKPGLIKDAYIYGCDSIMLDLEDAVAENQKESARFSLYHALKTIDYGDTEVIVRINGLDTPHWQEDIRVQDLRLGLQGGNDHPDKRERRKDTGGAENQYLAQQGKNPDGQ